MVVAVDWQEAGRRAYESWNHNHVTATADLLQRQSASQRTPHLRVVQHPHPSWLKQNRRQQLQRSIGGPYCWASSWGRQSDGIELYTSTCSRTCTDATKRHPSEVGLILSSMLRPKPLCPRGSPSMYQSSKSWRISTSTVPRMIDASTRGGTLCSSAAPTLVSWLQV